MPLSVAAGVHSLSAYLILLLLSSKPSSILVVKSGMRLPIAFIVLKFFPWNVRALQSSSKVQYIEAQVHVHTEDVDEAIA